ncbi:MAG: SYF2 splicing factor-domain-containing protein [Benjaminiella poitrasii]|nr:MAG: SYF2 splicing factor-domain-containing protein [Benjaminiella poitrasii]
MPPKKSASKREASTKKVKQEDLVDQKDSSQSTIERSSAKRKHDVEENQEPNVEINQEKTDSVTSTFSDRMAKLKELKRRRATEVEQGNRRDRNLEFQRSKENPKLEAKDERKKAEALKLLEKQEAEDKGEDYERKQFWRYSAESVEAWEKRMAKKAQRANTGFSDHTQAAHKKYTRLMSDFKPDMHAYNEKKLQTIERAIRNGEDPSDVTVMANSLDYAGIDDKPSNQAINRLAEETKKQIEKRETRSRERKEPTDDISWINEKNRVFNQKIARFYDKYTKEIRDNLERGTAL